MFELKYKITDTDMEKINKSIMWKYFIPYILVACAGLVVGIIATVFRPSVSITVLGIILIVLGAILAVCAILLAVLPKSFVTSVILPDETLERRVKFDDGGITVSTEEQSDIVLQYLEVTSIRIKDFGMLVYFGGSRALPVLSTDKSLMSEIAAFIDRIKTNKPAPESAAEQPQSATEQKPDDVPSEADEPATEQAPDDKPAE